MCVFNLSTSIILCVAVSTPQADGYSLNLKKVPNLSNATNLETLILSACGSLLEIPTWFQNLSSLKHLKMVGCKKLEVFQPTSTWNLSITLISVYCTKLKTFQEISTSIILTWKILV